MRLFFFLLVFGFCWKTAHAACGDGILDFGELCDTALSACCAPGCLSILPGGTPCRLAVGGCDIQENCTGISAECPADMWRPAGYECRSIAMGSPCDVPEFCTSFSPYCPIDMAAPNSTVCRVPGPGLECVEIKYCPGTLPSQDINAKSCPPDTAAPNTTSCRRTCNQCDVDEYCPGPGGPGQFVCGTDYNLATTTNPIYSNTCTLNGRNCELDSCNVAGTCTLIHSFNCENLAEFTCPSECEELFDDSPHNNDYEWNRCIQEHITGYKGNFNQNTSGEPGFSWGVFYGYTDNAACTGVVGNWTCVEPRRFPRPTGISSGLEDHCYIGGAYWFDYGSALTMVSYNVFSIWNFTAEINALAAQTNISTYVYADILGTNPENSCEYCDGTLGSPTSSWSVKPDGAYCILPEEFQFENNFCGNEALGVIGVCDAGQCIPALETNVTNWGRECRTALGPCDITEYCSANGTSPFCPMNEFYNETQICHLIEGNCDSPETCNSVSHECPIDEVYPEGFTSFNVTIRGPCEMIAPCDGQNKTSGVNGTMARGPTHMCRSPVGPCDAAEFCPDPELVAEWWLCPDDEYYDSSYECRPAEGLCDIPEFCSGNSTQCDAPDLIAANGTICRTPAGDCDLVETCDGISKQCPVDLFRPMGFECRAIAGSCDLAEQCNGTSAICPDDEFASAATLCQIARGPCENDHYCTGQNATCPDSEYFNSTVPCRLPAGICDAVDYCPGNSWNCTADAKLPNTTSCRAPADLCDAIEFCTGFSDTCPADGLRPNGAICRISRGPCEVSRTCNGLSISCPPEQFYDSTVVCRTAVGICDVVEHCDPFANQPWLCPVNAFAPAGSLCATSIGACSGNGYCSGLSGLCPGITIFNSTVQCRAAQTQCDQPEYCNNVSGTCPSNTFLPLGTPCSANPLNCTVDQCNGAGTCVVVEDNCECMQNIDCPVNITSPCVTATCVDGFCVEELAAGFCFIDGQCVSNTVINPANGCQHCDSSSMDRFNWSPRPQGATCDTGSETGACSAQDTCDGLGTCVDRYLVNSTCRAAVSICDSSETCPGNSDFCPTDVFAPPGTPCRNATDLCDVAEYCNNLGQCPIDSVKEAGTICAAARGPCETPAICDGVTKVCSARLFLPAGTECRAVTDVCDVAETCDGQSYTCPPDGVRPSSYPCRLATGPCDRLEMCDGILKQCPADQLWNSTHLCRLPSGSCEYPGYCTLGTDQCEPISYKPAGTICQPSGSLCAASAMCNGANATCPSLTPLPNGTQCHVARGPCEGPGFCNGLSLVCQNEGLKPLGTVCRVSTDAICDPQETCNPSLPNPWLCPFDFKRPNGYPCSDSIFCNGDETCQTGVCTVGPPRNCTDNLPCTVDSCNEQAAMCLHSPNPQIGTVCYDGPMGTADVGICRSGTTQCMLNGTFFCANQVLPKPAEICGNQLDDDCNGVPDDGCTGVTCIDDSDCIPFSPSACQEGVCNVQTNLCEYPVIDDMCRINSVCVIAGWINPQNPCQSCQPNITQSQYWPDDSQDPSDNNVCNGIEACMNGQLVYIQAPLQCPVSPNSCSLYTCDSNLGCLQYNLPVNSSCSLPFPYACEMGQTICNVTNQCDCAGGVLVDVRDRSTGSNGEGKFPVLAIVLISGTAGFFVLIFLLLCFLSARTTRRRRRENKRK